MMMLLLMLTMICWFVCDNEEIKQQEFICHVSKQ